MGHFHARYDEMLGSVSCKGLCAKTARFCSVQERLDLDNVFYPYQINLKPKLSTRILHYSSISRYLGM